MKKVLVTGAGGFVGARILQQWQGWYELCTFPKGLCAAAEKAELEAQVESLCPDVIIHAAALSDTGYCAEHPQQAYRANVQLPEWLAEAARKTGAKLVAFSSDQVYAGVQQPGLLPETAELCPANVYGRYKLEAEQRVLDACPEAVLLRAAWMYDLPGYGLPIRGNLPLNLIQAALRGTALSFSARDHRGVTYVRQVIQNLEPAMRLPGGVYNFGSENELDMVRTARAFAQALGVSVLINEADWPRNLAMDCTKLRDFGIQFDTTQQGIERCLRDYGLAKA